MCSDEANALSGGAVRLAVFAWIIRYTPNITLISLFWG